MTLRTPRAWTVAAFAILVGAILGSGTAMLESLARPFRIGDFAPGAIGVKDGPLPVVDASEIMHDFGSVGVGATGFHEFVVGNSGRAALVLTRGATSCTCTVSDFEASEGGSPGRTKTVEPGSSTKIKVQWRGKGDGGPFRQQATILTNDPRRPEIAFMVEGIVVPTWKAFPESVVLSKLSTGASTEATVKLFTFGAEPPVVTATSLQDAQASHFFSVFSSPLEPADIRSEPGATGGILLTLKVQPGLPIGPIKQVIQIVLRIPEEVTIDLPLEGSVSGDLALAGSAWDSSRQVLALGTVSSRVGLSTQLFLTAKGPHREAVHPIVREVVPPSLEILIGEAKPVGSGSVIRIPLTITIPPGSSSVNHLGSPQAPAGRIVLETGLPESPTLTILICVAIGP